MDDNEKMTRVEEHRETVDVEIDNRPKRIAPGTYVVSELKERLGVPPEKDLDEVIAGNLTPLVDTANVTIKGGEVFFSHVRRGGSS